MTIETETGSTSAPRSGSAPVDPSGGGQSSSQAAVLATSAKDSAATVASRAGAEVRSLTDEAAGKARDVLGDARSQLKSQASEQAGRAAGTLRQLAGQLSSMASAAEPGMARDVADMAAEKADRFAGRLDQDGIDSILADVRRFARNQPGLFLLGAAAAGALAGRLLKSVDTHALVEAAKPGGEGSTDSSQGSDAMPAWSPSTLPPGTTQGGDDTVDLTAGQVPPSTTSLTQEPEWAPSSGSQR